MSRDRTISAGNALSKEIAISDRSPADDVASERPTELTLLTPVGRSAVAVVSVEGPRAAALVERHVRPARSDRFPLELDRLVYGTWRSADGSLGEDLIVVRTGVERFEIQGHGGLAAPERLLSDLVRSGGVRVDPWRRLVRDSGDTCAVEARWLAGAPVGLRGRRWLEGRALDGRTAAVIDRWLTRLETPEPPPADHVDGVLVELRRSMVGAMAVRRRLVPTTIAIVGPANAGKSRLANALLGYERSLVFDRPGTTRDTVETEWSLDGWPLRLIDTAGERLSAEDDLERLGQALGATAAAKADLVIRVIPADELEHWSPIDPPDDRTIVTITKGDLLRPTRSDLSTLGQTMSGSRESPIVTSCVAEPGIASLERALLERLDRGSAELSESTVFTKRQLLEVRQAIAGLESGALSPALAALRRWKFDPSAPPPEPVDPNDLT